MNKECQEERKAKITKWDEAIAHTHRQLELAERRVKRLQSAVKTYEWNRDRGFPWPGSAARN